MSDSHPIGQVRLAGAGRGLKCLQLTEEMDDGYCADTAALWSIRGLIVGEQRNFSGTLTGSLGVYKLVIFDGL